MGDHREFTLLRVLEDRLIIERIPDLDQIGRIWVPEQAKRANTEGYVVAIGEGLKEHGDYCPVNIGDRVLFSRYAGVLFNYGSRSDYRELVILRLGDIHGIFTEGTTDAPAFTEAEADWKY